MAARLDRRYRIANNMAMLMTMPPPLLRTVNESFLRTTIADLQKESFALIDEKNWLEAGDLLTNALILFDLLKGAGYQKRGDSTNEENILLLRAACGLKLGAFEVALNDTKQVLDGDPDKQYAREIKVLAECEIALKRYREGQRNMQPQLERCRRQLERLKRPLQWDAAHFDMVTKEINAILGPKVAPPQPGASWASMCGGSPRPPEPPTNSKSVDDSWIPKQAVPKATKAKQQSAKPAKKKKKSRSRRHNKSRRETDNIHVADEEEEEEEEEDDTETESEAESSSSPGTSEKNVDIAGLDDFGVTTPVSKPVAPKIKAQPARAGPVSGLDEFGFQTVTSRHKSSPPRSTTPRPATPQATTPRPATPQAATPRPPTPQRKVNHVQPPQRNGPQSSAVNGAVPKVQMHLTRPPQSAAVHTPPPPKVSPETREWLNGHDLRIACQTCFKQLPNQYGLYSFRYLQEPKHKLVCQGSVLICRLTVPPRNGLRDVFGRIRPRTKPDFNGTYTLCTQFQSGIPCKISTDSCWFCHSTEEMEVWNADRKGRFNGREIVTFLKYKLAMEKAEIQRSMQAAAQARVQATTARQNTTPLMQNATPKTQAPSSVKAQKPVAPPVVPQSPAAPPVHVPTAGGDGPPRPQQTAAPAPAPFVDGLMKDKLIALIKNIGGQFLYLCRHCFDDAPQMLSVQSRSNPAKCSGEKAHTWNHASRCLVHAITQNGRSRYWKVRKRPNGIPPKAFLCWHRTKTYGCPVGSKCHFAHNEVEVCLWLFEAYHTFNRDSLVAISNELIYGPPKPPQQPQPQQQAPVVKPTTPAPPVQPQQQAKPVFPFEIKIICGLCFTKIKQMIERNPRKPMMCSGPNPHPWGSNPMYMLKSPTMRRWIRVQSRHPKLRPEIQPMPCRRGERCEYREMFSNQCMFPHVEEERLLWIYQNKVKAKTIEEVVDIQRQQASKTRPGYQNGAGGDGSLHHHPQPMLTSHFHCSYCDQSFRTKQNYDSHVSTREHKMRIKSDTERSWKYRSPPLNVTNGEYKLCIPNTKNMCNYSGVVQERNDCTLAHSEEELEEWKERHEYRMMKIAKAKEQKLYTFVDELLAEYNQSSTAEYEVMTEEIPGISTKCSEKLKAILPVKDRKHGEEITFKWDFVVNSARKSLRRVGLLYDEHRLHFHLSQPADEDRPQVCPGGLISEIGGTSYQITIHFHTRILGLFHQWVVFDFGEKPVLLRKLSIHIGSSNELDRYLARQKDQEKIKLWDSGNSQIIKFTSTDGPPDFHEWEKKLMADYKQPSTLTGLDDVEADQRMNEENYKLHMHRMLNLEELECMERLTRYSAATEMVVSNNVEAEYPYGIFYAQNGELFGTIKLEKPLYDDSEASQIVLHKVSRALIKFNRNSDIVYEATIIRNTKAEGQYQDTVCVHLSAQCVQEQNLQAFVASPGGAMSAEPSEGDGKRVQVVIQFQLDRVPFVSMHHAVDNLSCMTVMFPPYPQRDRFDYVSWQDVERRVEPMNPRQEKAARYIHSAGGLRGAPMFRGKGPVIIFGPFGTGKTYTMANSIKRTLLLRNDSRILICTHSNSAADLYITEHLDKFCEDFPGLVRMIRMYQTRRLTSTISPVVWKYVLKDDAGKIRHPYDSELQDWAIYAKTQQVGNPTPNIVIATLNTAVHLTRNHDLREYFTHIIIDEAGQALETEAIIPLQLATNDTCIVLAGDHKQMSPKVYSSRARSAQFHISLLERLFTYNKRYSCKFSLLLTYNYRTCPQILDFLAQSYYKAHLESRGSHPRHPNLYPLNFFVVKGEDQKVGTSHVNNEEMLEVAFRVEDLCRNWPPAWGEQDENSIAVLTPYTLQVHLIRKELRRRHLGNVVVDTIQNVQGKQFRAVIISTVRTRSTLNQAHITALQPASGNQSDNEFYYAFLSDERLLNTAFTRAKSVLFVVGDPVALCSVGSCHMTWLRYVQECEKHKSIFPPETTVEQIHEEIAAAKQRLNPAAMVFQPRKPAAPTSQQRPTLTTHDKGGASAPASAWATKNSIWGKSSSLKPVATPAYQRFASEEFPSLESHPTPSQPQNAADEYDEDEFEDVEQIQNILDDDLLQELRIQVKEDIKEELRVRNDSSGFEDDTQDTDSTSDTETPVEPPPRILRHNEPMPEPEPISASRPPDKTKVVGGGYAHAETEKAKPSSPIPVSHREPEPILENLEDKDLLQFRMVEREGRIALLPRHLPVPHSGLKDVEEYDSDEDEIVDKPDENVEDEFLEKTVMYPEKFKVCTFRYDLYGRTYAIPLERESSEVISITSKKRRGQALDNDEVIIEILENTEEPEVPECVEGALDDEEDNKIYGKVVHIMKRDTDPYLRKVVCTLDPFADNLMVPIERTFPKMFVTTSQERDGAHKNKNVARVTIHTISREAAKTGGRYTPERDVFVTNKERPHKLFVVRYWKWYPKTPYPLGVVTEELQPGTTARQGLHILKLVHGVKDKFKIAVDQFLQTNFPPNWTIPKMELDRRTDFRGLKVFTIDPAESEDLDDAVSVQFLEGNRYEVGIHIADVSYFIKKGNILDEEASVRATSFYPAFHEKPIHMLPKRLSTEFCSLLPNIDRLALSLVVILDSQGRVIASPNVFRTVIRSCQKLSYNQAEEIILGGSPQGLEDVIEPIRCLHNLTSQRRAERLGAKKYVFSAEDDDGVVEDPLAHSMIEELMILANTTVADHLIVKYSDCTPLRRQLAPQPEKVEEWKKNHEAGVHNSVWLSAVAEQVPEEEEEDEEEEEPSVPLTTAVWEEIVQTSNDSSQKGFDKLSHLVCLDENHPLQSVALSQYYGLMERAEYVNSGDHADPKTKSHFSLHLKAYVHFTSPIRRYIDLVVHRLLIATLEGAECPYESRELANITHNCSSRSFHAQRFSKETQCLQLALKLQEAPLQLLSFVESFSDSGLKLLFPFRRYILPQKRNVAFNLLKPSKRPETSSASQSAELAWKSRIYDLHRTGRQTRGIHRKAIELDCTRYIVKVPEDHWQDIQNSVKTNRYQEVKRAVDSAIENGGQALNQYADLMSRFRGTEHAGTEVSCEYVDQADRQQFFIDYKRPYRRGDVNQVQLYARLHKGVIMPHVQLFNMTPKLDFCTEHRAYPVQSFSDVATQIPSREKSITAYKNAWLPILSMLCAHGAVSSDDTILVHNITITWQKMEGGKYQGYFNLPLEFIDQRSIRFHSKMKSNGKEDHDEDEDLQLDFLCIRYANLLVSSKKLLRMRDFDTRVKQLESIGPYNRHSWEHQTFIAHGHSISVQKDEKAQLQTVTFQLHTTSLPFPEDLLLYQNEDKQRTCSVELIPKPEPEKRMENAVRKLNESTPLIRSICLQKPRQAKQEDDDITKFVLKEGAKVRDLRVPDTGLHPLNTPQQDAVRMALTQTFSVIQGPPGTGKTVTGAYLAYFFTLINKNVKATGKGTPQVLYCGPSNKAVDVISVYLRKFDVSIVRVYSEMIEQKAFPIPGMPSVQSKWQRANEAKEDDRLTEIALHRLIRQKGAQYAEEIRAFELRFARAETASPREIKTYKKLLREAEAVELKKHSIVLCTCNAAGASRIHKHTNIIQCIVDEAGMCNEPETLIPLVNTLPHQIVLIGDHKQLRPIITEPNARDLGMEISLLEKYKQKARMLTIQYRMHEAICAFPSATFYQDKLVTDASVKRRSPDPLRAMWPNHGRTPTVFCHVYGKEETLTVKSEEGNEMSKANMGEVYHATRIVNQLIRRGAKLEDIVVLSQYRLQCAQIEDKLKRQGLGRVKVCTVVTSQGSEWEYVILSTVRSKPRVEIDDKPSKGWQRKHLGFIIDENQMNVALTRAKQGLIIVGNQYLLETHPRWRDLLKKYRDEDCVMEARKFPPFPR